MKGLSAICSVAPLLVLGSAASTGIGSFAEDNDLWREDGTFEKEGMTKDEFNMVINYASTAYQSVAKQLGVGLQIRAAWEDSTVNAVSSRLLWSVTIKMYGGLARRPEVSRDAFALVVCHELGHAFAGEPYANNLFHLSAEGMSDYYAAGTCMKRVLKMIPVDGTAIVSTDFTRSQCSEKYGENTEDYTICLRQLEAGQGLGNLLAIMKKEKEPNYQTPDTKVVRRTITTYPETTQCRLDTYLAGALEKPRPQCWFVE